MSTRSVKSVQASRPMTENIFTIAVKVRQDLKDPTYRGIQWSHCCFRCDQLLFAAIVGLQFYMLQVR
jgi:hypothetical protein